MARRRKFTPFTVKHIKRSAVFCFYCFREMIEVANNRGHLYINSKTVDHFHPLDKGGNNFQYNMVICCYQCNQLKGNLLPGEFNALINQLWQREDFFKYSKNELRNIMNQIKYIKSVYDENMKKNKPYFLIEIPRKLGLLEQLRLKHKTNGFSFSDNKHRQTAEC